MNKEATRFENNMYQPMESTNDNVQWSKRKIKPTRRYIEKCDYVAYVVTVASKVEGGDDMGSYKETIGMIDAISGFEP